MEHLEANHKLFVWLFDDPILKRKYYLARDCGGLETFQDFFNSLCIDYD